MFAGILSAKVSINQNITGIVGNTDTSLTCSFFLEKGERILSIQIIAKDITENFNDRKSIAGFKPEKASKLYRAGKYLFGRVTLTNISTASTNAKMTFHKLKCEDEKDYICNLWYTEMDGAISNMNSKATRILLQSIYFSVHSARTCIS